MVPDVSSMNVTSLGADFSFTTFNAGRRSRTKDKDRENQKQSAFHV